MEQTLENGQVVQTITIDLADFVARKQEELQMISIQMNNLINQQSSILSELQSLIPTE